MIIGPKNRVWTWDAAVGRVLAPQGSIPAPSKLGMVIQSCNPSTREIKARRADV